jgi:very-short-patch-repair endonuclease
MTISEVLLWNELRNKQILGYDFDRQRPIDNFIVDFYCKELMLAIEIDGDTHIYKYDYDEDREKRLESLGVSFLRFDDKEVKKNMNNVLRVIEDWIIKKKPTPNHSREGSSENETLSLKNKTLQTRIEPTPAPSREGNPEEGTL